MQPHPLPRGLRDQLNPNNNNLALEPGGLSIGDSPGVPPTLACTLRLTNSIESMISNFRDHTRNVKRWRDGQMALHWCAAGMVEASKRFRRANGHLHLPALRTALERAAAEMSYPSCTMTIK
jgi:hypothetical protein